MYVCLLPFIDLFIKHKLNYFIKVALLLLAIPHTQQQHENVAERKKKLHLLFTSRATTITAKRDEKKVERDYLTLWFAVHVQLNRNV